MSLNLTNTNETFCGQDDETVDRVVLHLNEDSTRYDTVYTNENTKMMTEDVNDDDGQWFSRNRITNYNDNTNDNNNDNNNNNDSNNENNDNENKNNNNINSDDVSNCSIYNVEVVNRDIIDTIPNRRHPSKKYTFKYYCSKLKGQGLSTPAYAVTTFNLRGSDIILGFFGALFGIGIPTFIHFYVYASYLSRSDLMLVIGSFGASAVLLYSAPNSDFAQPRNVIGGHFFSALMGVCIQKMVGVYVSHEHFYIPCALSVAAAITCMNFTRTVHPPGGATALLAVLPSASVQNLGFTYVLMPVFVGATIMTLIAVLVNNIPKNRIYPKYWY